MILIDLPDDDETKEAKTRARARCAFVVESTEGEPAMVSVSFYIPGGFDFSSSFLHLYIFFSWTSSSSSHSHSCTYHCGSRGWESRGLNHSSLTSSSSFCEAGWLGFIYISGGGSLVYLGRLKAGDEGHGCVFLKRQTEKGEFRETRYLTLLTLNYLLGPYFCLAS